MNQNLYAYIAQKKHHIYRRTLNWSPAEDFRARMFAPALRMAERFERLCQEEQPVILPNENIVFLRTVKNIPDVFTAEEWTELKSKYHIHELGYLSNLCPDYYSVIADGLLQRRKSANELSRRAIDSLLNLSDRYLQEAQNQGRQDLVEILTQVPRYPARNFREALQFFRILHFGLWLEGNYHNTVGRFDLHMYPYLEKDLQEGRLNEEQALHLVEEFFLNFNKDSDLYPGVQQGDNGQSLMLGGVDANGNDVFNLLSQLCLKASRNNGMIDPKINLRVSSKTPAQRFTQASALTKAGLGFPQYSNDDVVIPALEKLGYAPEDAADYTVAACWEVIIPGKGTDTVNIGALSFPHAVDRAVKQHLLTEKTYDGFFARVKQEICEEAHRICDSIGELWFVPSPFMDVLMGYDTARGGKYNNYGIHGTGIATATDSLAAIQKYVFEEGTVSKERLLNALENDFADDPELLHRLRYEAPKLGNNEDSVDAIATLLLDTFADALRGRKNCRGGIFRAGTGSAMYYLWHGRELGATADGRRAGEPFGTNYSVSLFARVQGPVSVVGSMTKQHFENAINGGPLTLEFHQSVFTEPDGEEKVGRLVQAFICRGGHQLQLNTVDTAKLLDAQKNPQDYTNLVVRIWGWSAYFVELDKEYQDHVIARQAYTL